jgi:hypothetical protein
VARTELTVQVTSRAGITPNYQAVAAANDAMFLNTSDITLHIKNASGSTANIVFETPATILSDALAVADAVGTVANGAEGVFGPFPAAWFNQASGADAGKMYVNVDQAVTIYAERQGALS